MRYRYLLFAGENYYPEGGANDIHDFYADGNQAIDQGRRLKESGQADWWHVYDMVQKKIVWHQNTDKNTIDGTGTL